MPSSNDESHPARGSHARVVAGVRWGLLATLIVQLSTVISTVVPARLLEPEDFAVVVAATVVFGLFSVFAEIGIGHSITAAEVESHRHFSTVFWAAAGIGIAFASLIAVTASLAAGLIGNTESAPFIAVQAVILPLGMGASVIQGLHLRRMNHRVVYLAQICQAAATAVVPVALVLAGFGAWGLILGRLAGSSTILLALFLIGREYPSFVFDWSLVKGDMKFNLGLLGSSLGAYSTRNLDYWVLGRSVSSSALGAYYVAFVVPQLIRQRATWMGYQLVLPMLVEKLGSRAEFERIVHRTVFAVAALVAPLLAGLSVTAPSAVELVFGAGWEAAIAPLQVLAFAALVDVVVGMGAPVFVAKRATGVLAKVQFVRLGILAVGLAGLFFRSDVRVAAFAVLFSSIAGAAWTQLEIARLDVATVRSQIATLFPVAISTVTMTVAVMMFRYSTDLDTSPVADLALCILVGGGVYATVGRLLFPGRFNEVRSFLLQIVSGSRFTKLGN